MAAPHDRMPGAHHWYLSGNGPAGACTAKGRRHAPGAGLAAKWWTATISMVQGNNVSEAKILPLPRAQAAIPIANSASPRAKSPHSEARREP